MGKTLALVSKAFKGSLEFADGGTEGRSNCPPGGDSAFVLLFNNSTNLYSTKNITA